MIRVVKVNRLRTPEQRAGVVYVGRPFAGWPGHALANPFKIIVHSHEAMSAVARREEQARATRTCLYQYQVWLCGRPVGFVERALADLWEETNRGEKPLGCWCVNCVIGDGSPVVCHAQIIGEMLRERFEGGS